jgi:hypothetical protein
MAIAPTAIAPIAAAPRANAPTASARMAVLPVVIASAALFAWVIGPFSFHLVLYRVVSVKWWKSNDAITG